MCETRSLSAARRNIFQQLLTLFAAFPLPVTQSHPNRITWTHFW
jgi:hypothetical protein